MPNQNQSGELTPEQVRENERRQADFLAEQREAICGPEHRYLTGTVVGHDPNQKEIIDHWFKSGATVTFRQDYEQTHPHT